MYGISYVWHLRMAFGYRLSYYFRHLVDGCPPVSFALQVDNSDGDSDDVPLAKQAKKAKGKGKVRDVRSDDIRGAWANARYPYSMYVECVDDENRIQRAQHRVLGVWVASEGLPEQIHTTEGVHDVPANFPSCFNSTAQPCTFALV